MKAYTMESAAVLEELKSTKEGLSSEEAQKRLEENGKNKLKEPEKATWMQRLLGALNDPMIFLLLGAAGISTATTIYQNIAQGANESYADLFIILFVVVINSILSMVQEAKAEAAIDALKQMTAATSRVMRDGKIVVVKSEDLVCGDIVVLEAGDAVPADCRILESYSMKVEEAALTGESVPVSKLADLLMLREEQKDIPLGDRLNMIYSGSVVVYGRGLAVVTDTGMNTEIGKIADALSQAADETTPLARKMGELSVTLTKVVIAISAFVFVIGVLRDVVFGTAEEGVFTAVLNTFIIAVALAVAAVPEGLPAVTTIIMSIGVTAMSKKNALIRHLSAVETLGCTQIICTDKTGTLTQNKMTVVDTFTADPMLLAKAMACCNDAKRCLGMHAAEGEPTECALVNHAHDLKLYKDELDENCVRIGEAPFDSGRKMMSTVHNEDGKIMQFTKGACEILLEHCDSYLSDGAVMPMNDEYRKHVMSNVKIFADRALRVLGAAYREYKNVPDSFDAEELEHSLTFIGFVGMIDPCRPEVYTAVQECRRAGIRPVMITGDHIDTAVAIAKELQIITDPAQAIEGAALEDMTDEDLLEKVVQYSVYARVQPEHKTRIVRAWKARNQVTAMTGDGVNDAPSIKAADIGVGMGITGTAVTKSVCDMVLADDNFATIVSAVEEGRKIYDNIRKVIQFQLATNLGEVMAVFCASMMGFKILSAAHLLWVNMVTDSAPGLALGMEEAEEGIMERKPRSSTESFYSGAAGITIVMQGVFMGLLVLFSYFFGEYIENGSWKFMQSNDGMTMAFLTCNFAEMFVAFCCRSLEHSIFTMKGRNKWLWMSFGATVILTCVVIYVPLLANLFGFTPISTTEFLIAIGLAFTVVPVAELAKWIHRSRKKKAA